MTMPENCMQNAQGHYVPVESVRPIDKTRDELVKELVKIAKVTQQTLRQTKNRMMQDVSAFVDLSAERYDVKLGGSKGNITLLSFDGRYKIVRQMAEHLSFDEGLQAAKSLIDDCLREWTKDSSSNVRALVDHAFRVDREGKLNMGAILSLRRLEIDDARWQKAMKAISESLQVTDTREYVRVYERDANGRYNAISLDMAAL